MYTLALAALLLLGLVIIPLGLPGVWLMLIGGVAHHYLVPGGGIGWLPLLGGLAVAILAEVLDVTLAARYTKAYGGTNRGAWGAIIGGLVGAFLGVPVPIVGSVLGAIGGSFVGALIGEYHGGMRHDEATRAATGAALGRVVAMGAKAGAGCVVAAWMLAAAAWG
jgi:uncharacterized protein YqgC (DUF456 family)